MHRPPRYQKCSVSSVQAQLEALASRPYLGQSMARRSDAERTLGQKYQLTDQISNPPRPRLFAKSIFCLKVSASSCKRVSDVVSLRLFPLSHI